MLWSTSCPNDCSSNCDATCQVSGEPNYQTYTFVFDRAASWLSGHSTLWIIKFHAIPRLTSIVHYASYCPLSGILCLCTDADSFYFDCLVDMMSILLARRLSYSWAPALPIFALSCTLRRWPAMVVMCVRVRPRASVNGKYHLKTCRP